ARRREPPLRGPRSTGGRPARRHGTQARDRPLRAGVRHRRRRPLLSGWVIHRWQHRVDPWRIRMANRDQLADRRDCTARSWRRATNRPRHHGGRSCPRTAAGFSLIEIVAAFAILALGMGLCMEIATSAMRQSRQAAEYTQAALNAKSLLDTVGIAERLEEGSDSGEFDERYRWELSVIPYESEVGAESGLDATASGVELYRLELLVTWQAGRGQ